MIEVVEPGLHTTVQDRGRHGLGHLGAPVSGAADPWSLAVANALAGNPPDAAALEVTAAGPRLRALADVRIAVAGADLGASVGGDPLAPGRAATLREGAVLDLPAPPARGLRAYVAFAGGLDVPVVLGSRSTCVNGGFGGLEGRALRAGDRLALMGRSHGPDSDDDLHDVWAGDASAPRRTGADGATVLRVLPTPLGTEALSALATRAWRVSGASDRMGVRLEPAADGKGDPGQAPALPSHGVVPGTIQLPPDGRPILLGVDHQTTGGYPVAGVVISADLPALGQLAPGELVRLEAVDVAAAQRLLREQAAAWEDAVRTLQREGDWDALWRSAGA